MKDDEEYPILWIISSCITACCNFLASALCLFAFQALIRNSSIRKNSYNIYVIFLILPDALQNLIVGFWNVFSRGYPQGLYEVSFFVWFFYFVSNFYLNAVVAYEINILATASYRRQRIAPPKLERAWKQVAIVYLFALVISIWVVVPYKWSPIDIDDGPNRSYKWGSPNGGVISGKIALMIFFGFVCIPLVYVIYIRIRIAWNKLLPTRGRTRVLSLFFMRIMIVFLLFYLPNTILTSIRTTFSPVPYYWISYVVLPLLNAFQAYVTFYMVLSKEDIRKAVVIDWNSSFGKCCCHIATTVQRRPSAGPSNFVSSSSLGNLNLRPSTFTSSTSLDDLNVNNPSSSRPAPTLPKKNEWDEEDFYPESTQDSDPLRSPEGGSEDMPQEDHSSASHDEERRSNCRDCTDTWVKGQTSSGDT